MIFFQHARVKFALFFDVICKIWAQGKMGIVAFKLNMFQRIFGHWRVWFEGKTLKNTSNLTKNCHFNRHKKKNKKSVEWGRPPPPGYGKFHTFYFFYFWNLPLLTSLSPKSKFRIGKAEFIFRLLLGPPTTTINNQ